MTNPFKFLFPSKEEEPHTLEDEETRVARQIEINKLKAENQRKADEAAEAVRKLTVLIEQEGISGVFFVATGAERRSGRKRQ